MSFIKRWENSSFFIINVSTTLEPNLGVVKSKTGESFVIADIPGIIEGASQGVGLGLQFLRHIERTRLLLHLIDVSGISGRDPIESFNTINEELKSYSEKLVKRTQIIVATKIDAMQDDTLLTELIKFAEQNNLKMFKISSVTGEGVNELLDYVSETLKTLPKEELFEFEDRIIYTLEDEEKFHVERKDGMFIITGKAVERLMGRVNIGDNESLYYFHKCLRDLGVDDKLREMGIKEGDIVKILDYELEWE